MNFIEQLFNSSLTNFDPLSFLGVICTVIASIYVFHQGLSMSFTRERHDKLISPLFSILEPILYQTPDQEIMKKVLKLIDSKRNLVDGKLLLVSYSYKKNNSIETFKALCLYIDSAYDKSCIKLGLKLRPINYRLIRKQYTNKFHFWMLIGAYSLMLLAVTIISFIFMLFLFGLSLLLIEIAPLNIKFIIGGIYLLIFAPIYKYISK